MPRPVGRAECVCTGCGAGFGSMSAFDLHQTGVDPVVCHAPGSRGLVQVGRAGGRTVWVRPRRELVPVPVPAGGPLPSGRRS